MRFPRIPETPAVVWPIWQRAADGHQSRCSTEPKIILDTSASANRTSDIYHTRQCLSLAISLSVKCLGLLEMPLDALFGLQLLFLGISWGTEFGQLYLSHHVCKVPEHYLGWLISNISPQMLLFVSVVCCFFPFPQWDNEGVFHDFLTTIQQSVLNRVITSFHSFHACAFPLCLHILFLKVTTVPVSSCLFLILSPFKMKWPMKPHLFVLCCN